MNLIVGVFFGIQEYIFSNLKSKKSASILRGRSFDIYGILKVVSTDVLKEFSLEKESLIFLNSGRFYIKTSQEIDTKKLQMLQEKIDKYFLSSHQTNSGINLLVVNLEDDFKNTLKNINEQKEIKSFQKFSLWNKDALFDKDYKDNAIKNGLCEQCDTRVKETESNFCEVCNTQAKNGNDLRKNSYFQIGSDFKYKLREKDGEDISKHIPYVPIDKDGSIKSFDEIAENSENLLIALKADIDNLGDTFFKCQSIDEFIKVSNDLDDFMTNNLKSLIKDKNIYTVFSGGDDLFLIGEFCDILELLPKLKIEFSNFSKKFLSSNTLSLSTMVIKNTTPINYIVENLEESLKNIKSNENKNRIFIFEENIDFDNYISYISVIENEFKKYMETIEKTTSFYYRLLEISSMKRELDSNKDILKNSKWASMLSYFFKRTIIDKTHKNDREKADEFLEYIYRLIIQDVDIFLVFIKKEIYLRRMEKDATSN